MTIPVIYSIVLRKEELRDATGTMTKHFLLAGIQNIGL